MDYYSAIKQNDSLIHVTTWVNFKIIMLNEISRHIFKNHTVCFNLHEALEQANLIYVIKIRIMVAKGDGRLERGTKILG